MKNIFLSLLASLLLTPLVLAQSGLDKAVVVAGLTTTSGTNTFAWIALQPTDPGLLLGKQIAVYRKTGAVTSASPYASCRVPHQSRRWAG